MGALNDTNSKPPNCRQLTSSFHDWNLSQNYKITCRCLWLYILHNRCEIRHHRENRTKIGFSVFPCLLFVASWPGTTMKTQKNPDMQERLAQETWKEIRRRLWTDAQARAKTNATKDDRLANTNGSTHGSRENAFENKEDKQLSQNVFRTCTKIPQTIRMTRAR